VEAGEVPEVFSALPRVQGGISADLLGGGALAAALLGTPAPPGAAMGGEALTEAATNAVLGYPIDAFQVNCLATIVQPGVDLMAMAVYKHTQNPNSCILPCSA
jgi:hypothetical protein